MKKLEKLNSTTTEVTIANLSHDGRGIARLNGKTIFVDNALANETVRIQYFASHSRFDEAIATEVITPAAERVTPKCAHFLLCGGCSLQHLNTQAQIELKQQVLLEQLNHIGGLQPQSILPALTATPWGYRRKARLGVRYLTKKNKLLVGFREKNGRFVADIQSCQVLHPSIGENLTVIAQALEAMQTRCHIPQIEIAVGDDKTALIVRHLEPLSDSDKNILIALAQQHQFYIYLQPSNAESIELLWPQNKTMYLSYYLAEQQLELLFHPADFTQINADINQQMVTRAIELLKPKADERMLDLFCGLGNFTLAFAKHVKEIVGVEGSKTMVERAQMNAQHNAINNASFYCADLFQDVSASSWAKSNYDILLLDPPRSGANAIADIISQFNASRILYISCNPATLARDAKIIAEHGYVLNQAGVMDMFPHTSHVEAMALFTKVR